MKIRDLLRYKPSHDSEGLANNIVNYITVIAQGGAMATRPAPLSRDEASGWNEKASRIEYRMRSNPGCLVRLGRALTGRTERWELRILAEVAQILPDRDSDASFFRAEEIEREQIQRLEDATLDFCRERRLGGFPSRYAMPAERMIWTRETPRGKRSTSMLASYARIVDRGSPEDPGA